MTQRLIEKRLPSSEVTEGAGVTVMRSIGTARLRNFDPFLMLDHFASDDPNDYIAGFPQHPHRGFITLTYMIDGHMEHKDSMGNTGQLKSGGVQWMKAASGVIHSEMPRQVNGLMRGFQLWINLPAREKMSSPGYQEFSPDAIPAFRDNKAQIKVISGTYVSPQGETLIGPVVDETTQLIYLDVSLSPETDFEYSIDANRVCFIYCMEGEITVGSQSIHQHELATLDKGDSIQLHSGSNESRFILVAGRPIGEPIVQYGPFVMNTQEEIEKALRDYRDGVLVKEKASVISD